MKIIDGLHEETVMTDLKSNDKKGVLEELSAPMAKITGISHNVLVKILLERERLGSTGIGDGIGIPHGKLKDLDNLILGFGLSQKGVNFDSLDGRPTHIFFLLFTPENSTGLHLKLLARISKILKNDAIKKKLLKAANKEEVFFILKEEDENL